MSCKLLDLYIKLRNAMIIFNLKKTSVMFEAPMQTCMVRNDAVCTLKSLPR